MTDTTQRPGFVDCGWAGSALEGTHSGDLHVIAPYENGVLVAVIDGLGHGFEAGEASRAAARLLTMHAGAPVAELIQRCHEGLRRTRGAVMSLAALNAEASSMTWIGVGNVEALLLRADRLASPNREAINLRGGVVGYELPPLREATIELSEGDTLVMATDGIASRFAADLVTYAAPQQLADSILERHARGTDDALALVARYLGNEPQSAA